MLRKENRYERGRHCLLVVALFSAVNAALTLAGAEQYFLFSGFAVYVQSIFCRSAYEETGAVGHLIIGIASAVLVIGLLCLCWAMARTKKGWILAGLALMVLDTLVLLYCCVVFDAWSDCLLDFIFHGLILLEMTVGAASVADGPLFERRKENIDTWNRRRKY